MKQPILCSKCDEPLEHPYRNAPLVKAVKEKPKKIALGLAIKNKLGKIPDWIGVSFVFTTIVGAIIFLPYFTYQIVLKFKEPSPLVQPPHSVINDWGLGLLTLMGVAGGAILGGLVLYVILIMSYNFYFEYIKRNK